LLLSRTGYHRVNLSMMLAGSSWAVLALRGLTPDRRLHLLAILASVCVLYAQSLTAGRAGYIAWAVTGLVLCVVRWRAYLLVAPALVLALVLFMPSVSERILFGVQQDEFSSSITLDDYDLTSGRIIIWPLVLDKIRQGPMFGFGRMAMWSTGIVVYTALILTEDFGHPHNAYLEWLLDNGIVGFIPVMAFYAVILFHSLRLFRDRRNGLFMAAGGMAAALTLGLLCAAMGSQTFYPVEGTVGMWCAIGLMLRLSVNRTQALARLKESSRELARPGTASGMRPVAVAASSMEELLWPATQTVELEWSARRMKTAAASAGTSQQRSGPEAQAKRPHTDMRSERPESAPRFIFTSEPAHRE